MGGTYLSLNLTHRAQKFTCLYGAQWKDKFIPFSKLTLFLFLNMGPFFWDTLYVVSRKYLRHGCGSQVLGYEMFKAEGV